MLAGAGLGLLGVPAQQLRAGPHLGGAGRRGGRRHLGDRVVRPLVRARVRGRDHARHAVDLLHEHGGVEQRPAPGRPAARRRVAGGRRAGDERRAARASSSSASPRRSRTRSSASTPTPGISPSRSRSSSPCSPSLVGVVIAFRMMRLPDPAPSTAAEGMALDSPTPG